MKTLKDFKKDLLPTPYDDGYYKALQDILEWIDNHGHNIDDLINLKSFIYG